MRRENGLADFLSRVAIFVIILVAIVGVFGWYLPLIKENQSLRHDIATQQQFIARLNNDISEKKLRLDSYQNDPRCLDRLARESLLYSREGETVYRFESRQK